MKSTFTILRIRGIPIGAHWSWLFVFGLITWSLSSALFPATYPGLEGSTYLAMGIVTGVLFFVSILLHELGHAFRALREGMKIDGITLWLFGGVARFKGSFPSAGAEFRIAIAGPLVSALIATAFGLLTLAGSQIGWSESVRGVADYLWRINALVLAFNLVPALPLDGGRVLRAWLWRRQASFAAATTSAARAGKAFGGLLVIVGLLNFIAGGGAAAGLWLVFLGWFLAQAADAEASMMLVRDVLEGRSVADVMSPHPAVVPSDMSVDRFLEQAVGGGGHSSYPVVRDEELVGLVSLRRAGEVPPAERSRHTVAEAMLPRDRLQVLNPKTDVTEALEVLQEEPKRAPVTEDGKVVGFLSISDIVRALEIERARGARQAPEARRAGVVVWIVVGSIMLAAAAWLYHPPLIVLEPGPTVDVGEGIRITGTTTDRVHGTYLLTSVRLARPSALGLAAAALSGHELAQLSEVIPEGADQEEFLRRQREIFRQSRMVAAAAAARATGMSVSIRGSGAVVQDVVEGAPADDELQRGDVIVAVDGRRIRLATDLQQSIRARPAGTAFTLVVERSGRRQRIRVRSARLSAAEEGLTGIGVLVSTRDFAINLPFDISFTKRDIGGPSAGLVYALAIADMLDPRDYAGGDVIAATGTVDIDGEVGRIGGIEAKAVAVKEAGTDTFFVPESQLLLVDVAGLDVRGVSDLQEALEALRTKT